MARTEIREPREHRGSGPLIRNGSRGRVVRRALKSRPKPRGSSTSKGTDQIRAEIHCKGVRRGGSSSSTPNSRPEPAQAPARGALVARTAGAEREARHFVMNSFGVTTRSSFSAGARAEGGVLHGGSLTGRVRL